jgi:CheY-like chemotaxis protein
MAAISCTLLVDDDATTNYLNQTLLQRMAVTDTVLVAGNGQEALTLLQQHCVPPTLSCPALILLDINMPLMNGFEFLQAYARRRSSDNPAVVIIMLTTSLNPRDVERIRHLPVAGYLTKPLTRDKIAQLVEEHFGQ